MRFGSSVLTANGSMSGNITSFGIDLQQEWIYSIQANWYGIAGGTSGAGSVKLQISNDNPATQLSGPVTGTDPASLVTNWVDYAGTFSSVSASTGTSSFLWNVIYPGYRWVRAVYTQTSGSGVMNINFFGKGN